MILDYGTPGSGVIERTVLDQQGSPYSRVSTWTGSPDNPANYTLHYQSGNLNSIANAEGWGVYSENSFLTGKLLVGDLTKAGQYMEYANGELNIKGKITVTGGNAATKADVDAAIDNIEIGGRNLIPVNTDIWESGTIASATGDNGASTARLRTIEYIDAESNQDYFLSIYSDNKIALLAYDSTGEYIGFLGSQTWITDSVLLKTPSNTARLRFVLAKNDDSTIGLSDLPYVKIKLELGNRATDWTPAPEDVTAEIAAAETSAKGYADGAAASAESAAKTFATAEANAALTAAKGHSDTLKTRVETRLGLAQLEDINETLITGGKVRTALLEATEIKSLLITAENIEGLTLNFDKGTVGGWAIDNNAITSPNGRLHLRSSNNRVVLTRNLTPFLDGPRVQMYYNSNADWGLWGSMDGSIPIFQLGSTNQIDGFEFGGKALSHVEGGSFVAMNNHPTAAATAGGLDSKIYRGFGIYHNDTEIDGAANAFRAIRIGHLASPADDIPDGQSGIQITRRINNVDKDIFRVDGDKEFIASINFSDSEMWGSFPGSTPSFNDSPARIRLSSLGQGDLEQPFIEVGLRTGTWSHMGRFGIASVELNGDNVQRPLAQITHNGVRCNYYPQSTSTSTTTYTEMQNNRIRVVYAGSARFEAYYNNNVLQLFARNLPSSASGLASGQIWRDASGNLKIV